MAWQTEIPGIEGSDWEIIAQELDEKGNVVSTTTRPLNWKKMKKHENTEIPPWDESLGEFSHS